MSLLQVAKAEEKNRLLGELSHASTKFDSLINHCASSLPSNEKQEMNQISSRISTSVKQLITYTEYGQPFDNVLEVLTKDLRSLVAFSQRHFPKKNKPM